MRARTPRGLPSRRSRPAPRTNGGLLTCLGCHDTKRLRSRERRGASVGPDYRELHLEGCHAELLLRPLPPLDDDPGPFAPALAKPEAGDLAGQALATSERVPKPVKVCVDEAPPRGRDLVHQHERGTRYALAAAERPHEGPHQKGLARAEIPGEKKQISRLEDPRDRPCEPARVPSCGQRESSHHTRAATSFPVRARR